LPVTLNVNGRNATVDLEPDTPLLYALRDGLELNAAKYGCGLAQCGACMVIVDGAAAFSCQLPISGLAGRKITTLEGLADGGKLSALQQAFLDEEAAQCGYCSSGMIMRATALLDAEPNPSEARIREHMQTNLCRCGTHLRIIKAVARAAKASRSPRRKGAA
jgi:nicotinate dehydrogenase subunit A